MSSTRSFGRWLKQRRKALDLTQQELAQRVGCSVVTIQRIETELRRPSKQLTALLARQLALPPDEQAGFLEAARAIAATRSQPQARPPRQHGLLPAPPSSFIGRSDELSTVRDRLLMPDVRLLTLTGPPGIGKTRLSFMVAEQVWNAFADGIFVVMLGPIHDPDFVLAAIASKLGLVERAGQSLIELIRHSLRERQVLLVLDNFEHVLDAAPFIAELLDGAPSLKVLTTSRAPLHLYGEHEFAVPPLRLPDRNVPCAPARLVEYEGIRLFVERAQAALFDFTLSIDNAQVIADICTRLDGLPLAIELAAAQVKFFTPHVLLRQLDTPLSVLTGGPRDRPVRHQTLHDAIAWSYDLLDAGMQCLFRQLGVFVGGWTLEAAEGACNPGKAPGLNVLDKLRSLLDQHLLQQEVGVDGDARFTMLATIRDYALEQLERSGEGEPLRRRHATYYLELLEAAEPALPGLQGGSWIQRLTAELGNLRAALDWCMRPEACAADIETGLRLCTALSPWWISQGYLSEGHQWFERALGQRRPPDSDAVGVRPQVLAEAHLAAGWIAGYRGDQVAMTHFQESLALFRALGDKHGLATTLYRLASLGPSDAGELEAVRAWGEESLALSRELEDRGGVVRALQVLGNVARAQGDVAAARRLLEESLTMARELKYQQGIAWSLSQLGDVALAEGNYPAARTYFEEVLATYREHGDKIRAAWLLGKVGMAARGLGDYATARQLLTESKTLLGEMGHPFSVGLLPAEQGRLAFAEGDYVAARAWFADSLAYWQRVNFKPGIVECVEDLVGVAVANEDDAEWSARLLGFAEGLRAALGTPLPPAARPRHERWGANLRTRLGEKAFAAAWAEGRAMPLEQAVAYALEAAAQPGHSPQTA